MTAPVTAEVILVWLAGKSFAFPVEAVQEVVQIVEPTPMPAWPEAALGMIDLRGELLPLVDISQVVDQPPAAISKNQFVVVLFARARKWGLVVDAVDGVKTFEVRLSRSDRGSNRSLSRGVVSDPGFTAVLLDPDAVVGALNLEPHLLDAAGPG